MKIFKKIIAVFLIFSSIIGVTSGCSISSTSGVDDLPTNGIVKKSVFEDAKKNSKMMTFHGKSGTVSYSWFFDGSSISSAADQNLKVDFMDAGKDLDGAVSCTEMTKLHFNEENLIQAKTTLEVHLPKLWNASQVRIYQKASGTVNMLLDAPLNNDKNSSVSFPVPDTSGDFYIVAKGSSFKEVPSKIVFNNSTDATGNSVSGVDETSSGSASSDGAKQSSDSTSVSSGSVSSQPSGKSDTSSSKPIKQKNSAASRSNFSSSKSASSGGKDKYLTDPTPAGKPKPVEPQDTTIDKKKIYYCTFSIDCKTILDNKDKLNKEKESVMPGDGIIMKAEKVVFYEGESVFDVLLRETKKRNIQMEYEATPMYNSNYIEGIHNLYEFDCGELSGWMYKVNGWYPNYGCSRYMLKSGDVVNWRYTCDLGKDVGSDWDVSKK